MVKTLDKEIVKKSSENSVAKKIPCESCNYYDSSKSESGRSCGADGKENRPFSPYSLMINWEQDRVPGGCDGSKKYFKKDSPVKDSYAVVPVDNNNEFRFFENKKDFKILI